MRLIVLLVCVLGLPAAARADAPVSFELEIQPIFTSLGCNAGACHGKARGQNGFALSLLAFDPDFDFAALAKDARGRRVFPASPSNSLLLLKATGQLPHGGGERIKPGDADYETLRRWIAQGMPRRASQQEPTIARVAVTPKQRSMSPQQAQGLTVTAHYSDGSTRDVTRLAAFQASDTAVASVDKTGLVKAGVVPGESVVMARFMHQIDTFTATVPLPGAVPDDVYTKLPRSNFIDEHVWAKLKSLGIVPSQGIDDAKFLRRAYLDILGRLPTAEEARAFLEDAEKEKPTADHADGANQKDTDKEKLDRRNAKGATGDAPESDPIHPRNARNPRSPSDRRAALIDALLDRPEYVDHWANKWADLLRPNPYRVGIKAVFNYDHWIRQTFRENWPYDRFVRELVTARGSTWENGAAVLFRDRREPDEITTMVSQLFLGIRLECAKCHHHPFEKWSQDDYYSFAAYFAKLKHKGTGLSPPISGGEEIIFDGTSGEVKHPITGKVLPPRPLFEVGRLSKASDSVSVETGGDGRLGKSSHGEAGRDSREALAAWITDPGNDFFAMVQVNRIWADLMGRPLVDPVDDLRITNPPTNEPLLRALAAHFREVKFDQKKLIRTIMLSHVYSLSSIPEPGGRNRTDTRYHSRHYRTRMRAEVLLDAVSDITGIRENFSATPPGSRAMQTWTTRINSITLDTFGRPDENLDPPCERLPDSTVTQALHLMMSPELHAKVVSVGSLASKLAASQATPAEIADTLYLTVYSRRPTAKESAFITGLLAEKNVNRRAVCEDVLWAMINSPEFLFND